VSPNGAAALQERSGRLFKESEPLPKAEVARESGVSAREETPREGWRLYTATSPSFETSSSSLIHSGSSRPMTPIHRNRIENTKNRLHMRATM
jgi:hypothetical protein